MTSASWEPAPAIRVLVAGVRLTLPVIELNGAVISDLNSGHHVWGRMLAVEVADAAVPAMLQASLEPIVTVLARAERVIETNDDDGVVHFLLMEHFGPRSRGPVPVEPPPA